MVHGNHDAKTLLKTGVFKNRSDMVHYLLLSCIRDTQGPIGSWTLKSFLESRGVECSTATVGRYLKDMDYKEFTLRQKNQGRVLTPVGINFLDRTEESLARAIFSDAVSDALRVNQFDELIDLFGARLALETETARQAALRATTEDLRYLRSALSGHQQSISENRDPTLPALDFHSALTRISHNKFMIAILDILIYEEKRIEMMFSNLVTRERGSLYVEDHAHITEAVEAHDADRAARLMSDHLNKIRRDIENQAKELNGKM